MLMFVYTIALLCTNLQPFSIVCIYDCSGVFVYCDIIVYIYIYIYHNHHHTVQVAICAYSFVRTLVNALVLQ